MEVRRLATKLSRLKIAFTLASSTYCAIHWLLVHNFSVYVFSAALGFGAIVATLVAWLSGPVSSSSPGCLSTESQRGSYLLPGIQLRQRHPEEISVTVSSPHEDRAVE
jgi:hypothetical protein